MERLLIADDRWWGHVEPTPPAVPDLRQDADVCGCYVSLTSGVSVGCESGLAPVRGPGPISLNI
jgi:hypothetical protein